MYVPLFRTPGRERQPSTLAAVELVVQQHLWIYETHCTRTTIAECITLLRASAAVWKNACVTLHAVRNFVDEYLEDYVEHFMVWRHTDKYGEKSTVRLARSLGNKQCLVCSHLASLTSMVLLNLTLQHLVEHGDTL